MPLTRRDFGALSAATATAAMLPTTGSAATTTSHGLSVFNDHALPPDFSHFPYANPDAPKGGAWSTGYGNVTFDSFNPFILKGNPEFFISGTIYDRLMTRNYDEPDALYGLIAESVEQPEDKSWVAFTLRREARHHDGTPLTSADVVFSFDTLRTKARDSYRLLLQDIEGVKADGPHRVRYDFKPGVATRDLPALVATLPVFSKAFYTANDFTKSGLIPPLGNGPYKVGKFEQGKYVSYDRVTDYWAADLPVNRGRFNFDEVRYDYFRDRAAQFEGLKAGVFLFNEEFWSKFWATAYTPENFPAIARGEVITEQISDDTASGAQGFWFNLRRKKFQDIAVREAIGLAFDFEWSNKRLFYDLYKRTDSFFENGSMQAAETPSPGELAILERFADKLPKAVFEETAVVPPTTDGSGRNRRALRQAAKILDAAGWTSVDGARQKDGETLEIEFLVGSQGFARIIQPMLQNMEKIGIKGTIREVDRPQYKRRMDEFDFDITTSRKSMQQIPGVELRNYFSSASASAKGSQNTAGVADPVIDALLDLAERAKSMEELTNVVKALDRVLRSMHIWIPQWHNVHHNLAYWDVFARPDAKPKYERGVTDLWWSDAEKLAKLKEAGSL